MSIQCRLLTITVIKILVQTSHIIRNTNYYLRSVLIRNAGQSREGVYFK
jgi:hypothetical protein